MKLCQPMDGGREAQHQSVENAYSGENNAMTSALMQAMPAHSLIGQFFLYYVFLY